MIRSLKNILLVCAVLLCTNGVRAQDAAPLPEGKIRYLITHNWTKKLANLDYISKQRKERNAYMWGGSRSEWKEYATMYFTPTQTKYEESEEKAEDEDIGYSWRKEAHVIRRDFANNTTRDHIGIAGKNYIIEDSIHAQDWKVMNDLKEVAGHLCMNASWQDTVKGQNIIAWFALDIPVSGGPERLCGLPGLILEANVNDGALIVSADKIELQKLTNQMDVSKKLKGKKVNEAEFQDAIRKQVEEKKKNEEPWFWGMRYF